MNRRPRLRHRVLPVLAAGVLVLAACSGNSDSRREYPATYESWSTVSDIASASGGSMQVAGVGFEVFDLGECVGLRVDVPGWPWAVTTRCAGPEGGRRWVTNDPCFRFTTLVRESAMRAPRVAAAEERVDSVTTLPEPCDAVIPEVLFGRLPGGDGHLCLVPRNAGVLGPAAFVPAGPGGVFVATAEIFNPDRTLQLSYSSDGQLMQEAGGQRREVADLLCSVAAPWPPPAEASAPLPIIVEFSPGVAALAADLRVRAGESSTLVPLTSGAADGTGFGSIALSGSISSLQLVLASGESRLQLGEFGLPEMIQSELSLGWICPDPPSVRFELAESAGAVTAVVGALSSQEAARSYPGATPSFSLREPGVPCVRTGSPVAPLGQIPTTSLEGAYLVTAHQLPDGAMVYAYGPDAEVHRFRMSGERSAMREASLFPGTELVVGTDTGNDAAHVLLEVPPLPATVVPPSTVAIRFGREAVAVVDGSVTIAPAAIEIEWVG